MDNHKLVHKVVQQALQHRSISTQSNGHMRANSSRKTEESEESRSNSPENGCRRIFSVQETVIDYLIKRDPNFQAIHDAFIIHLLLFLIFTFVKDSYTVGRMISVYRSGFGSSKDVINVLVMEGCLLLLAFSVHPLFKVWVFIRRSAQFLVDITFILLYATYVVGTLIVTLYVISRYSYPRLMVFFIVIEQFRLTMKSYSFIRENAYKVLYPWHKDDTSGPAVWYAGQMSPTVGSFSQYCYFLFCPTLLYRDHYPRTPSIRWYAVILYFAQFLVTVWCCTFIVTNVLYPLTMKESDIMHSLMLTVLMAFISVLVAHTSILYAYLNMWSELLCFADRKFYDDWWACTSFSSFYRKWNLLVHDWIHSYVYLDMKKFLGKRLAVFSTILVSSIVHEYMLAMPLGFVLPVVTFLFAGIGMFFYVLKPLAIRRVSNLFILGCFSIGTAIIIFCLLMEYKAREYCPLEENTWANLWTPQAPSCYVKSNP